MNNINVILNGRPVKANNNEYIINVAKREGIIIPSLCNDERLEPYSSCYVCVVEIEGNPKPQPACSTRVREGMVILTESEKVKSARRTALNLLLSNHYADCVAPCKETCPAGVDVQGYISLIEKGLYNEAVALIKEVNPLPAICGRVCVRPCEAACRRNLIAENSGVGIDYLKRFVSDYDLNSAERFIPEKESSTGKKVAIIGAGPGGLTAAYYLQLKGHQCDIYEAQSYPGGWLRYGIPEYRLPNDIIDKEVKNITALGVNIYYNRKLGEDLKYKEINDNYDATILCIGSQRGSLLGAEGEDADGVFSGIDFLRNMETTGQRYDFRGKKIIVVGGGNTAMDCCRSAIRCGSTDVKVIYRRTEKEMPANPIEIHESKVEGVEYLFLHNPIRVNKDNEGKVKTVTLIKMGLGEPDQSGRRRPVPVEGSEFEIEADYILAAIGQKTDINFLDDINSVVTSGQLKANKWGDIDADSLTLQTGVPHIFAAGDGVSGPATLIEAIAQANKAWVSCHQYLTGQEIIPLKKKFVSRKDNLKKQIPEDYSGRYQKQLREEMPVLNADDRVNYKEVELGYTEQQAVIEIARCFECGCSEFFDCKLQKYAELYNVDQKHYGGEFKQYEIDFSHPLIEIDNNKCILCAKCIRICSEVVGANALGLVQRGFDTYVAPAMDKKLTETNCENCGMCISVCPTGAITENIPFKVLPVKPEKFETIDCFTSEGARVEMLHKKGFIFRSEGINGLVNKKGSIGKEAKFGYRIFNDPSRLKNPMVKNNGKWEEISFDNAFGMIKKEIYGSEKDTMVFAGGRLSNEELYLAHKFVRGVLNTGNINSLNYLGRGEGYICNTFKNLPFSQLDQVKKIYIFGSDLNYDNSLVNHFIFKTALNNENTEVILITDKPDSRIAYKCDRVINIKSYHSFFKAMNFAVIKNRLYNKFYIEGNTKGFDEYSDSVMSEDFSIICRNAGISEPEIACLVNEYNNEPNAAIVFQEKEISSNTSTEIFNLVMLTGKLGKTGSGIICIKEKNNSQGLIDMGISPYLAVGGRNITNSYVNKISDFWGIKDLNHGSEGKYENIRSGKFRKFLIFGEDPLGTAIDKDNIRSWFRNSEFMVVQDYFLTETAMEADMVLPASFNFETGGSFTNTQKYIQQFSEEMKPPFEKNNLEQFSALFKLFGIEQSSDPDVIFAEIIKLLNTDNNFLPGFLNTSTDNISKNFNFTCDIMLKKVSGIVDFN